MTAHDRAVIEQLIAEAREDDARMEGAPWIVEDEKLYSARPQFGTLQLAGFTQEANTGCQHAIARQRNNLASMIHQLEASKAEVARLRLALHNTDCAGRHYHGETLKLSDMYNEAAAALDTARSQLEVAKAEAARLSRADGRYRLALEENTQLLAERETLRAEVGRLTAELAGRPRTEAERMDAALDAYRRGME